MERTVAAMVALALAAGCGSPALEQPVEPPGAQSSPKSASLSLQRMLESSDGVLVIYAPLLVDSGRPLR